jgi:hypothetical protein
MATSNDLAEITRFMMTLVEDPRKLEAYKSNPTAAMEAAHLPEGALSLLKIEEPGERNTIVVIIFLIIVVVAVTHSGNS